MNDEYMFIHDIFIIIAVIIAAVGEDDAAYDRLQRALVFEARGVAGERSKTEAELEEGRGGCVGLVVVGVVVVREGGGKRGGWKGGNDSVAAASLVHPLLLYGTQHSLSHLSQHAPVTPHAT